MRIFVSILAHGPPFSPVSRYRWHLEGGGGSHPSATDTPPGAHFGERPHLAHPLHVNDSLFVAYLPRALKRCRRVREDALLGPAEIGNYLHRSRRSDCTTPRRYAVLVVGRWGGGWGATGAGTLVLCRTCKSGALLRWAATGRAVGAMRLRRYARALQEVRVGRLATLGGHRTRSGRAAAGAAGGGQTRCGRGVRRRAHGERLQQQVVARRGVHACNEGDKRTAITARKL